MVRFLNRCGARRGSRAPLDPDEQAEEDNRDGCHGGAGRTHPFELPSAELYQEQHVQEKEGQQRDAASVYAVLRILVGLCEPPHGEGHAHHRQRHVDVEYPVPGHVLRYVSAYEGADPAPDPEERTEYALHPAPVLGSVEIRDGGGGDRDQYAPAEPLDRTADDEHLHVHRHPRDDGPEDE